MALFFLPAVGLLAAVGLLGLLGRRWWRRGGPHLLVWLIAMAGYAVAGLAQLITAVAGWSDGLFRVWYLGGTLLVLAWLAQGSLYLVAPRRVAHLSLLLLLVLTVGTVAGVGGLELEPAVLAEGVAEVDVAAGFDPDRLTASVAALYRATTAADETPSPLARSLAAAAPIEAVPAARVEVVYRGVEVIGLVEGHRVVVGGPPWLLDEGVEIDVEPVPSGGHALYVAIDGRYAGRLRLLPARHLATPAILDRGAAWLADALVMLGAFGIVACAGYALRRWSCGELPADGTTGCVLLAVGASLGIASGATTGAAQPMLGLLALLAAAVGFLVASRPDATPPTPERAVTPPDPGMPAGGAT